VVVDVGLFGMVTFLVFLRIVVTVGELVVIVRMGVPIGAMLKVVTNAILVVVTHVPMIVGMGDSPVRVGFDLALSFSSLDNLGHRNPPRRPKSTNSYASTCETI
jgi:hypothetical protein